MTLADLFRECNVATAPAGHEHSRPGWLQLDCPACGMPGHFRLGFNLSGKYFHCWACGKLPLGKTLVQLTGLPWNRIKEILDELPAERPVDAKPRGTLVLPDGLGPLLGCHRQYLIARGFDPDFLQSFWGIRGIGLAAKLPWRLWIPVNYRNQVVSWTTRSLTNSGTRYLSAMPEQESMSRRELLYGQEHADHSIIVCEGPIDCWAIGPGAVATMGLGYSRAQLALMARYPSRTILFDSEPAAQRRARKLANELSAFPGETAIVTLETGKDPAEAAKAEIDEVRNRFLDGSSYATN